MRVWSLLRYAAVRFPLQLSLLRSSNVFFNVLYHLQMRYYHEKYREEMQSLLVWYKCSSMFLHIRPCILLLPLIVLLKWLYDANVVIRQTPSRSLAALWKTKLQHADVCGYEYGGIIFHYSSFPHLLILDEVLFFITLVWLESSL